MNKVRHSSGKEIVFSLHRTKAKRQTDNKMLGYNVSSSGESQPIFQRNIPLSSMLKNKPRKKMQRALLAVCLLLSFLLNLEDEGDMFIEILIDLQ